MVSILEKLIGWYIPNKSAFKYAYLSGLLFLALVILFTMAATTLGSELSFSVAILGVDTEVSYLTLILLGMLWIDANLYVRRHQRGESNWSYGYTAIVLCILLLASVALHELGHAVMAMAFSNPVQEAGISWWGAYVKTAYYVSPIEQILIAAAGPGTDFLLFLAATWYVHNNGESLRENAIQYLAWVNYLLIMYNLLPIVVNTDGGKILHGMLRMIGVGQNWLEPVTFVVGVIICLLYILYRVATNPTPMHKKLAEM